MAACIFNIKKAINLLKSKSEMKFKFLYEEEVIYNSETHIILDILENIKLSYK